MWLLMLLSMWVDGEAAKLGADSFDVREAAQARLSCPLLALCLPPRSDDPEIDARLKAIRSRQLRWMRMEYLERAAFRSNFGAWLDWYFIPNRSGIDLVDVHAELTADWERMRQLAERWGGWCLYTDEWCYSLSDQNDFRFLCDYHRAVAPAPRPAGVGGRILGAFAP